LDRIIDYKFLGVAELFEDVLPLVSVRMQQLSLAEAGDSFLAPHFVFCFWLLLRCVET
jgi:hypothetical protein